MKIPLNHIEKVDWDKKWVAGWTFLTISDWGEYYYLAFKKTLGMTLNDTFFLYKEGVVSCFQSKKQNDNFGQFISDKIDKDKRYVDKLYDELKKRTDELESLSKKPVRYFLKIENYEKFELLLNQFLPYYGATHRVANYLSEKSVLYALPILEKARKYSERCFNKTDRLFRGLLKTIARKEGLNETLALTLFHDEFKKYLLNRQLPSISLLQQRIPICGLLFIRGKRIFLTKPQALQFENMFIRMHGLKQGFVQGVTAGPGKVRGLVRILHGPNPRIFNEGDILITGMTRPDFVPLMKKAGAIVTDAGGILSHAAIIARELKKPCVIGTATATKAFKDGDMVEVDADKGIVRII